MGLRFCKGKESELCKDIKLTLDKNIVVNAHLTFAYNNIEYIPIYNTDGEYLCCCYDDKNLDKIIKHIQIMTYSERGRNYFKQFEAVTLVSCNEIGILIYELCRRANCKVYCVGELWNEIFDDAVIVDDVIGFAVYCEGNPGLLLKDLGTWRNTFPFNEYDFLEDQYTTMYRNKELYDKTWLSQKECNEQLIKKIQDGIPFMAARLGNTEASICRENTFGHYSEKWLDWLFNATGFFSESGYDRADVDKYVKMTIEAIGQCDYHCCRFDNEIGLINQFGNSNSSNVDWYDLYSNFDKDNIWLTALAHKKVLIVSSVNQTIKRQYSRKKLLFQSKNILPDMDMLFYDAPQTQLGNKSGYKNWFEAYEKIVTDIRKIDFDIAIIAAGAYGYPLAAEIKAMGKQSIELCSGIYPIFGIKVKTQLIIRKISQMYNNYWIFPIEAPPENYMNIEKGAYWE